MLLLSVIAASFPASASAGQLQQIRDEVRSPDPPDGDHDKHSSSGSSSCDDDGDGLLGNLMVDLAPVFATPWSLPHYAAGDDFERPAYFSDFPYSHGFSYVELEPAEWMDEHRDWGGFVRGEFADDFDNMSRIGGRLVLENTSRFGIDTEANRWRESLAGGAHDHLWTGDFNCVFRFAQNDKIAMRSGIGFNWLNDQVRTDYGFNFTYGLDYFPRKPWVLSADIDWGWLGAQTLFHGTVTAGVLVGRVELFTGYDFFEVGNVRLNGLVAGLGIWF